jgi:hypothetical protein
MDVRIIRLNTDKTRKDMGSDSLYHVYFELSGYPPVGWSMLYQREWKESHENLTTSLDGAFLVIHCRLDEVKSVLPALKKAVDTTNTAFRLRSRSEEIAVERRQNIWKEERRDVDAMAGTLQFD